MGPAGPLPALPSHGEGVKTRYSSPSSRVKDAEHPKQHLHKDGTCKFPHVCSKWVTGKGPGGMCGENHPMYSCTNPNKTNTKPTQ